VTTASSCDDPSAPTRRRLRTARGARALLCALAVLALTRSASASDQIFFPATDNVIDQIVQRINAETVRLDVSAWLLTEHLISQAIAGRVAAGLPVRVIGDRVAIFESDPNTKTEFYYMANLGVPIRLRFNPTWYPEIDHWKMAIFVGQNVVEFGSANYTTCQLAPCGPGNYDDETAMFTDDPTLVNAFKTKFDRMWNDTTPEPESIVGPPYLKNWADACRAEPTGCDFFAQFPNAAPMNISTARLEPDNPMPPDLIWGQGPDFNNRLVTEINNEPSFLQLVIYRLTVDSVTNALLSKWRSGVPMQLLIETSQYANRLWPEYWITHANIDKLWAAGVPIKQRVHTGLTHMKTLVTSAYATNASSNYAAGWERDHDYFVSASGKPAIYTAIKNYVTGMWNNSSAFAPFQPQPPDAPTLASPASGAGAVATNTSLVWNIAPFATDYDVYLGTSSGSMVRIGNTAAQLVNNPPSTYSLTPPSALCPGTTYFWQVVSRTFATPVNPSMIAPSTTGSFTTAGTNNGCTGGGGTGGGGGGTSNVPAPWATQDIGSVGIAGSATYANGTFTVNAAGADIWGSSDSFRYVYQPISGDGQIVARVTGVQNTNTFAKAGVMLRSTLDAGSAHVILDVRPDGSVEFMTRSSAGSSTSFIASGSQGFPAWLKLTRSGSTVTGSTSADGATWTTIGTTSLSIAAAANIGLAVTSHNTAALNTSTFDNVTVSAGGGGGGGTLPSPWTNQDVGAVGVAGSASASNGTFTVNGAGADIWGSADAFQYAFQALGGDGQIVARVTSVQNTNTFAKGGVMLRETTSAGSAHVILDARPNGSIELMTRSATNGSTAFIAGASASFPVWLRLSRSGSTVTGAISSDGSTWTPVGSTTTAMSTNANIGLAVTSHNTSVLNTSTFDNVSVTAGGAPPPPPPGATNVVIYASDIPASARHGSWTAMSDGSSPNGVKLATPDQGVANTANALASPTDYVDVTFNANAGTPYRIWLRMQATGNSKLNDSLWVQFSDASAGGSQVYPINTTSGLLVNLATDSSGSSLSGWGWQNTAYWLSQATTVTFPTSGSHTLRIQVREDGVQFDQIVLSPGTYLSSPPGPVSNDSTIVPKS